MIYSINFIFLLGLKSCNRSCLTGEQSFHRTRNHEISTFTVVPSIFLISNLPKKYIQSVDNLPFIRFSRIFGSVTENNHANPNEDSHSFASHCLYYNLSLRWTRTYRKFLWKKVFFKFSDIVMILLKNIYIFISVHRWRRSCSMDEYGGTVSQSARNLCLFFLAILPRSQSNNISLPWNFRRSFTRNRIGVFRSSTRF